MRLLIPVGVLIVAMVGCSSSGGPAAPDAGGDTAPPGDHSVPPQDSTPDSGPVADAPSPDTAQDGPLPPPPDAGIDQGPPPDSMPVVAEQEPNDGATVTEFNDITMPSQVTGSIGQANDTDVFRLALQAGDRLVVTVKGAGGLQPHLAIFGQPPLDVPPLVSRGAQDAMAELYVVESGNHFIGVRDRRNVDGSAGVGDPSMTYTMTVEPLSRPPIKIAIGGEASSKLEPAGTVRVFAFDAVKDDDLSIEVFASRLSPPSEVDSRLSLFFPAQKAWLGTNDNPDLSETDSLLQGKMPFTGTYHAIVENVADTGTDYRFKLTISQQ